MEELKDQAKKEKSPKDINKSKADENKPVLEETLINWKLLELKNQLHNKIQWLESLKAWYFSQQASKLKPRHTHYAQFLSNLSHKSVDSVLTAAISKKAPFIQVTQVHNESQLTENTLRAFNLEQHRNPK